MVNSAKIIVFALDELQCGIALEAVDRVVRMVEITPLPGVSPVVLGVINVQGEIVPVLDLRQRFGLPRRPVELSDQLIIARGAGRALALTADTVREVRECPGNSRTDADAILPDLPYLTGVVKQADGLILIHDPERLLSPGEIEAVQEAVEGERP